jgi:hypothetical protein
MPTKTWTVGEEMLAADVNAYLQDQVVATFANAAARDAAIPAPTAGQAVYLTGTGQLQVYAGVGLGWRPPWSQPWGILDYQTRTTNQALASTPTTLLTTAALTIPANRMLRFTFQVYLGNNTGTTNQFITTILWRGATRVTPLVALAMYNAVGTFGSDGQAAGVGFENGLPAGTYTWTVTGVSNTAAFVVADATTQCSLLVEDVGPKLGTAPS